MKETYEEFKIKYNEKCGTCEYLNIASIDSNGKCYCKYFGERKRHVYNDSKCKNYKFRKSERASKDYHGQIYKLYNSCYITTAIVNILGSSDNCYELDTLRDFRKNVLQTDEKYISILAEYDIIGPLIADVLRNDSLSYELSSIMYSKFIKSVVTLINLNEIDKAVILYTEMVRYFQRLLQIREVTADEIESYIKNTNESERGKGRAANYQRIRTNKNT